MADEKLVSQVEDELTARDTDVIAVPARGATHSDWPPPPPRPAEVEEVLAEGTGTPKRNARIYVAVRRPTTSSESR